jgi:hypothetical protein
MISENKKNMSRYWIRSVAWYQFMACFWQDSKSCFACWLTDRQKIWREQPPTGRQCPGTVHSRPRLTANTSFQEAEWEAVQIDTHRHNLRFQVLTATSIKLSVSWRLLITLVVDAVSTSKTPVPATAQDATSYKADYIRHNEMCCFSILILTRGPELNS